MVEAYAFRGPSSPSRTAPKNPKSPWFWGSWSILRPMRFRKQRGPAISLALACHPVQTVSMAAILAAAAAFTGRSGPECLLVAATVLTGQLTVGWINDVVDRDRD